MSGSKEGPQNTEEELGRNGVIPGWSEVVTRFRLDQSPPTEFNVLKDYYRGQRRIAEGQSVRGKRALRGLARNPDFETLEGENPTLLTGVASFVRRHSEKQRK